MCVLDAYAYFMSKVTEHGISIKHQTTLSLRVMKAFHHTYLPLSATQFWAFEHCVSQ